MRLFKNRKSFLNTCVNVTQLEISALTRYQNKLLKILWLRLAEPPLVANQQPWHFVAIQDLGMKKMIREAAEKEEQSFYNGGASDEWISALEPIGTGISKPHLTEAPWLIIVFAERFGKKTDGSRRKNYYVPESVGIAMGFLITAIHNAGLVCLEHTPNPMKFLNDLCGRPDNEKPIMILPVGHPSDDANIPKAAKFKKPLNEILTVL